jgi:D-lactate dehydrogenase
LATTYSRGCSLFQNVIITEHQAFFTREALLNIVAMTIDNITRFENGQPLEKLAC